MSVLSIPRTTVALGLYFFVAPLRSEAADTVEVWEVGLTDVDFYLDVGGIGATRAERGLGGDIMLGAGITERFSAYVGTAMHASSSLGGAESELYLGAYGTPIKTDTIDLDLFLHVAAPTGGDSQLQIVPSTELNYDANKDMLTWGLYLRAGLPFIGRPPTDETEKAPQPDSPLMQVELNPGAYWSVREGHQLFLEYSTVWHPQDSDPDDGIERGTLAFGYNVFVSDSLEIINEASVTLPDPGEKPIVSVTVGFVATLPSKVSRPSVPALTPHLADSPCQAPAEEADEEQEETARDETRKSVFGDSTT